MPAPALLALAPSVLNIGSKIIDKLFPDPADAAKAKLKLAVLDQEGELEELKTRMSAILAEAQSADPWTSRARPSFMYVFYIIVLAAIPMGVLHAVDPDLAFSVSQGFKGWLAAIPDQMWTLFGVGYVGYAGLRSWEKKR
jgi:hypothetical protein